MSSRWSSSWRRTLASFCPPLRVPIKRSGGIAICKVWSATTRKSIEPMALAHGFPIRSMQAFIGESSWRTAPLVQRHQQLVAHTLGEADAVILVDESGLPKQGQHSAAVAPQYCGALGKVANCQVGVFLGYASRTGYTLLDGQLFVPEGWFADEQAAMRAEVGMPADLTFKTKPALAVELV